MIFEEIRKVRYGQVRNNKAFILFDFRGEIYEASEFAFYPWTLDPNAGMQGQLRMKMLAAKALLSGEAVKQKSMEEIKSNE